MSDYWREDRERRRQMRREMRDRIRDGIKRDIREGRPPIPYSGSVSVHLIAGLVVIILGVLFLLSNLDLIELRHPIRYFWPAVFLSIGFSLVLEHRTERTWQWGIGWILVGVWSFAYKSGWINVDIWDLFWPLFLLAAGGYLVRRALTDGTTRPNDPQQISTAEGEHSPQATTAPRYGDKTIRGIGVLSGSDLKPGAQAMSRAELFALMGGVKLDLYDAQLIDDAATINVGAVMGGIEILVPSEWTVVSNVLPLMGAFIDKRRPAAATTVGTPVTKKTLTVNGFVLMGGVEIKN